jgi:hypothetical protein
VLSVNQATLKWIITFNEQNLDEPEREYIIIKANVKQIVFTTTIYNRHNYITLQCGKTEMETMLHTNKF